MTDFAILDSIYPLAPEELPRQWVLGQDLHDIPAAWCRAELGSWTLASHPDAHVCKLVTATGQPVGWVLEPMLQTRHDGCLVPQDRILIDPGGSRGIGEDDIERALYGRDANGHGDGTGLEGMWIAIVLAERLQRIYLGPIHSVVFDAGKRRVATSHNLLQPWTRDRELSRAFDPLRTQNFFSFGLTAFEGVERLLPNHYLDLGTFEPVRHWPRAQAPPVAGRAAAAAMIDHGRRVTGAVAGSASALTIPLSAGNDSRAVLAMARPFVQSGCPEVRLFTSAGPGFASRIDLQGARALSLIAGLPLEVRSRTKHEAAPPLAVMRHFARIGEAKSGPSLSNPALLAFTQQAADEQRDLTLAGMAGEVGRATYWSDEELEGLSARGLLERVGTPIVAASLAAAQSWLDGLPDFVRRSPYDVLDLAYVEQRLGCWEANTRYLWPGRPKVLSFMASGFCIEQMLRLPVPYRRAGVLQKDMVAYGWNALSQVPVNAATGLLSLEHAARRSFAPAKQFVRAMLRS